jgi:hypothetical protein
MSQLRQRSHAQPRPEKRPDAKTLFLGDVRIDVLDVGEW